MAIMKKRKRAELTLEDINHEMAKALQEIRAEDSSRANTGRPKNPGKYRELKRWVATLKMMLSKKAPLKTALKAI